MTSQCGLRNISELDAACQSRAEQPLNPRPCATNPPFLPHPHPHHPCTSLLPSSLTSLPSRMAHSVDASTGMMGAAWYTASATCDYAVTAAQANQHATNLFTPQTTLPPTGARIGFIGLVCSTDLQLHPETSETAESFSQSHLIFGDPSTSDGDTDFKRAWRHIDFFMRAISPTVTTESIRNVLRMEQDRPLIALSHTFFQVRDTDRGRINADFASSAKHRA